MSIHKIEIETTVTNHVPGNYRGMLIIRLVGIDGGQEEIERRPWTTATHADTIKAVRDRATALKDTHGACEIAWTRIIQ